MRRFTMLSVLLLSVGLLAGPARAADQNPEPQPEPITCANCAGGQCAKLRCFEKGGDMVVAPCDRLEPGCTGEGGYLPPGSWGAPGGKRDRPGGKGGGSDPERDPEEWGDDPWERDYDDCQARHGSGPADYEEDMCYDLDDLNTICGYGTMERNSEGSILCRDFAGPVEVLFCVPYGASSKVFVCHVTRDEPNLRDTGGLKRPSPGPATRTGMDRRTPGRGTRALPDPRVKILEGATTVERPAVAAPPAPAAQPTPTFTLGKPCSAAPEERAGFVWNCDHWERARAR